MVAYFGAMWRCRYFWMSLVKIDLRTRYRRSVIGLGWSLLRPISMTIILCAVFRRVFNQDIADYGPYLLSGLVLWEYIETGTKQGCQCFFQGEQYIRQHPAPIAIYPLRTALGESVHFLMALCVVLGLVWFFRGFANLPALLCLIPTLPLLFVFVWSLALIAGFANVYFQDTQHLTEVGFRILFYTTPIIYHLDQIGHGRLGILVSYNPIIPLLDLVRLPIIEATVPGPLTFLRAGVTVLITALVATVVCHRAQRQLIFHL
ncbi:MAG TPA: ABC transporter permease [Gemmataceae bacterium]|nr:ABC transporter permease [Gemmataceae bacterium]